MSEAREGQGLRTKPVQGSKGADHGSKTWQQNILSQRVYAFVYLNSYKRFRLWRRTNGKISGDGGNHGVASTANPPNFRRHEFERQQMN